MKKIFCLLLIISSVIWAQNKIYTLEESLLTGLKNNDLLKISESKMRETEFLYKAQKKELLPKLKLTAGYTRFSDVDPFEVSVPFSPTPIKIQDVFLNQYTLGATVTQPLFTGFRLSSGVNIANYNKKIYEVENKETANQVSLNIIKSYWEFAKIKLINILLEKRLTSVQNHVKDSKVYLQNGLITKNELLKLQVLESDTKIKLLETKDKIELARMNFNKAIGINLDAESEIETEIFSVTEKPENFKTYLAEAFKNRNEIKTTDLNLLSAKEKIKMTEASYYPQVSLFATVNYNNPNQRYMPLKEEFNESWAAGVSLNWEFWDWGQTSDKKQQTKEKFYQLSVSKKLVQEKIEVEVYKNYLDLITIEKQINNIELMKTQTKENLRISKKKYSEHLITGSDLVDAETDFLEAEIKLAKIKMDRQILQEVFKKSLGRKLY